MVNKHTKPLHTHCLFSEEWGEPLPSFPPWPHMLEKGGGVVIPCQYKVCPKNFHAALTVIEQHIENMPEKSVINVSVS